MLLYSVIMSNSWLARTRRPIFSTIYRGYSVSAKLLPPVCPHRLSHIDKDCNDFLACLENKAGAEISSALAIGKSSYGRTLYAADYIQTGDCILKVPYTVQLAPDNMPPEIYHLLGDEIGNVSKVAVLILHEKKLGKNSEWAPYISSLPEDLHSTIFWSDEELEMIRPSALYEETFRQKAQIEKDFLAVKLALHHFPHQFWDVTLQEFSYAYGLVTSRAWESSRGVSMIPFADFLNHDGTSEAYILNDETKRHSEVIADCDFAPGDEVMIKYGNFSNSTLLLDFGFTLCSNSYDQVQIEFRMPQNDGLYKRKLEILHSHHTRSVKDVNEFSTLGNSFTIRKVKRGCDKGKGIPQSIRAFCRVLTCDSQQQLNCLGIEAEQNDGRLARYPLKDKIREIAAHQYLLSEIYWLIEEHGKNMRSLVSDHLSVVRRQLARDLLTGELCVLESAAEWLENYCSALYR
ncbi:hypothetical protein OROGR_027024 [Orobanche gracilis]